MSKSDRPRLNCRGPGRPQINAAVRAHVLHRLTSSATPLGPADLLDEVQALRPGMTLKALRHVFREVREHPERRGRSRQKGREGASEW